GSGRGRRAGAWSGQSRCPPSFEQPAGERRASNCQRGASVHLLAGGEVRFGIDGLELVRLEAAQTLDLVGQALQPFGVVAHAALSPSSGWRFSAPERGGQGATGQSLLEPIASCTFHVSYFLSSPRTILPSFSRPLA